MGIRNQTLTRIDRGKKNAKAQCRRIIIPYSDVDFKSRGVVSFPMAKLIVFADDTSTEIGVRLLDDFHSSTELIPIPDFCRGLAQPTVLLTAQPDAFLKALEEQGATVSGTLNYAPSHDEAPEADPPDEEWREALGSLRLARFSKSLTDSRRFRAEVIPDKDIGPLIPIMGRLIRGGAYRPDPPVLSFEEEHRLIAFSPREIVISRADDLLDFWIILRTAVDLVLTAWRRRADLSPETNPRQGIGAVEIYRRLPGTNCGICGFRKCTDYAVALMIGKSRVRDCSPLQGQDHAAHLASLNWLLKVIGLDERAGDE